MRVLPLFVVLAALAVWTPAIGHHDLHAQVTRADTAMVILHVARDVDASGDRELAAQLYRLVLERYAGTPAAAQASTRLATMGGERRQGNGRAGFVVYNTMFGTWLGVAIPAAAGAEGSSAFGAGLLAGAGIGFLASNAYAGHRPMSSGQAKAYTFATWWLTWQAIGWRAVLDIGRHQVCYPDGLGGSYCYDDTPDEAPFTAAVVGGLGGAIAGIGLSRLPLQAGDVELVQHSALWGTWYSAVAWILTHEDSGGSDDVVLTYLLLGGDALGLAAIPAARAWQPTSGQVRLTSIAGVAGAIVGLGVDLLVHVDDDDTGVLIPTIGATAGLIAGAVSTGLTRGRPRITQPEPSSSDVALLNVHDGVRVALPLPLPAAIPWIGEQGRLRYRPGVRLTLFDAHF